MNTRIRSCLRSTATRANSKCALAALTLPAVLGFLLAAAPQANAMTISQGSGDTVNGAYVTGCVDIKGASTASGAAVDWFPCNGNANEQWYYSNGELIGLGDNCLTISSGNAVMEPCSGSSKQVWTLHESVSSPGATIEQGGKCLAGIDLASSGDQLILATCTSYPDGIHWILQ